MLKGIGAMFGTAAGSAMGADKVATIRDKTPDNFIERVEMLVSYLETGVKPTEITAKHRKEIHNPTSDKIKRFGKAYDYAYGRVNMGRDIYNLSYPELTKKYGSKFSAKGKYQIIAPTFSDLVNNGLYNEVPAAKNNFEPNTQDAIFDFMSKKKYNFKKAISEYSNGRLASSIGFLAREWESIPKDASNLSYYDGDGTNHALIDYNQVVQFLVGNLGVDQLQKK